MRDVEFASFKTRDQIFATGLRISEFELAEIAGFD